MSVSDHIPSSSQNYFQLPDDGSRNQQPKRCSVNSSSIIRTDEVTEVRTNTTHVNTSPITYRNTLDSRYGPEVNSIFRRLEAHHHKLAREENHLTFLYKCKNHEIVPKGLQIKAPFPTPRARRICERASRSLLQERINNHRYQRFKVRNEVEQLERQLKQKVEAENYNRIVKSSKKSYERTHSKTKEVQKNKLAALLGKKSISPLKPRSNPTVINRSKKILTESETEILSKGLNYAITPKGIPYMDIISSLEEAASSLPAEAAEEFRWETRKVLQKAQKPKSYLTGKEIKKSNSSKLMTLLKSCQQTWAMPP